MKTFRPFTITALVCLISACTREAPPPRTVDELVDSPFLLDAAIVRCAQDRSRTKYDPECVNAREATNRLATVDRVARQKDLEAQSARKRKALRRTQQAATEARRRAAEARRLREEAEYLGLYPTTPDDGGAATGPTEGAVNQVPVESTEVLQGNQPGAILSPPELQNEAETDREPPTGPKDIDSIREELKRRQDTSG